MNFAIKFTTRLSKSFKKSFFYVNNIHMYYFKPILNCRYLELRAITTAGELSTIKKSAILRWILMTGTSVQFLAQIPSTLTRD